MSDVLPTRPLWRRAVRWAGMPPPLERWLRRRLPRRLFARSILIVVLPMLVLQSVVAFVFLDRHWESMTQRLSQATAQAIAITVDLMESAAPAERARLLGLATDNLFSEAQLIEGDTLPRAQPAPIFGLLESALARQLRREVGRPFWFDTTSSRFVEIRVVTEAGVLKVVTRRSNTYASNSHITLVWMVGTSLVLIAVAVLFLRGQVRPIQELGAAAERFGRGRPIGTLRPHGAIEVRQATWAFLEMKRRIERQLEQRTAMLAGVSHDLRTMLTRFRLELELLGEGAERAALVADVAQMQAMLEDYVVFARTDADEPADDVSVSDVVEDAARGHAIRLTIPDGLTATLRPTAARRLIANLIANAAAHAKNVAVSVRTKEDWLVVDVDDDGPGIPPAERRRVFQPFYRLDVARNQDRGGTGLGLSIARDIAQRHGGDIVLLDAPLGGLRARVRLPL